MTISEIERTLNQISELDDDVLAHAVRRAHTESTASADPIAAFGAFNQHSSSPW
ncbi:hypothetical protein [Nocardia salmonicida]|uniref:hypothetical protein n=1 Tax=Nocardia salmonicida TaxID=53431 RepID=UPI003CF4C0AB